MNKRMKQSAETLGEIHEVLKRYEERAKLNGYDRENLLRLYYYQLAVCDYYYQYFHSENSRKEEFLWQAQLATNILKQSGANYLL